MSKRFKLKRRARKLLRREDRMSGKALMPTKTVDDVFVARGKKYHDAWCNSMNGVWLSGSNAVRVIARQEALARGLDRCQLCAALVHVEIH